MFFNNNKIMRDQKSINIFKTGCVLLIVIIEVVYCVLLSNNVLLLCIFTSMFKLHNRTSCSGIQLLLSGLVNRTSHLYVAFYTSRQLFCQGFIIIGFFFSTAYIQ